MAASASRQALHGLVDALPDAALDTAVRCLEALTTDDPILRAILFAPESDDSDTEEEEQATAEAEADAAAGRVVSHAEARRALLDGA
jgi:hypothetical protein